MSNHIGRSLKQDIRSSLKGDYKLIVFILLAHIPSCYGYFMSFKDMAYLDNTYLKVFYGPSGNLMDYFKIIIVMVCCVYMFVVIYVLWNWYILKKLDKGKAFVIKVLKIQMLFMVLSSFAGLIYSNHFGDTFNQKAGIVISGYFIGVLILTMIKAFDLIMFSKSTLPYEITE